MISYKNNNCNNMNILYTYNALSPTSTVSNTVP